ncbi:MAG: DUF4886 domain-containing protein [Kiritimatiellia bacterium]
MKILSVGNSFSNNAHTYLNEIAQAMEVDLVLFNAYIGGCTLERHMLHADAYDKNRNDPEGSPYPISKGCHISLRQALKLKNWDVVTIQQASHESFKPESYHPHGDRLVACIRRHAPKAEIVVHQTWAYREDRPFLAENNLTTDRMYKELNKAYADFCAENDFRMIPSGNAFQTARRSRKWGKPIFPKRKGCTVKRSLHGDDAFHANANGNYLLGCVWFDFFFGIDARKITFTPEEVASADAKILREIAHAVVLKNRAAMRTAERTS